MIRTVSSRQVARAQPLSSARAPVAAGLRVAARQQQRRGAVQASSGGGSGIGGSSGGGGGGFSGGGGGGAGDAHPLRPWTFGYAALLAAGGAYAFAKKGSTKSLTSASGAALILALAARSMVGGPAAAKGPICVALALAAMLALVMTRRFQATRKFMPAGLTAGVSLAMAVAYVGALTGGA